MKAIVFIFCLALLSACSYRQFDVNVDSICSSIAHQKKRYILLPGNQDGNVNDLQFQEFAAYTDKALQSQGFRKAQDEADVAIFLSYGISDPKNQEYTYSVPLYGQTGISSSKNAEVNKSSRSTKYSEETSYTPQYGIIGREERVGTRVVYTRYLSLSGVDLKEARELWSTKVESVGSSGDLREIFPILLIASQKHIGKNTGKQITYTLKEDKELLEKIQALRFSI